MNWIVPVLVLVLAGINLVQFTHKYQHKAKERDKFSHRQ